MNVLSNYVDIHAYVWCSNCMDFDVLVKLIKANLP